ncbi:hypothetical protein OG21DRAFT_1460656 [Imleria badia]|nr:hypothetical protein OG21DRAFT_1460656 [Imleria badia]
MLEDPAHAAAPFDHAQADVILRSSDNIDFRVFKLFLSLASPFFETLFNIPQPADETVDQEVKYGLAVIPVTEDSKTLDALLRFCYPCTLADDPNLEVLNDAKDVLEAARKYSLDVIEKKTRKAIVNPKILEVEPLQCFVIAHRGRLREETQLAARYTLTQPLIPSWFQEIELLTATDPLSLLTYHKKCGEAVYALKLNLSWITSHYGSSQACPWLSDTNNCRCSKANTSRYKLKFKDPFWGKLLHGPEPLQWWDDFMEETFTALRDKPCKETVKVSAEKTMQTVKTGNCTVCSSKIAQGMHDFLDLFTRKIEETVSQIELKLDF